MVVITLAGVSVTFYLLFYTSVVISGAGKQCHAQGFVIGSVGLRVSTR